MDLNFLKKENRDNFISENIKFIYKITNHVCKRSVSIENDEELSIAMIAFNKACDSYNNEKGDFLSYASIIIKNSLIDFFRKSAKVPYITFSKEEDNFDYLDHKISMDNFNSSYENSIRAEEIKLFTKELSLYKLNFGDLVNASPNHKDTRDNLLNIALACVRNDLILNKVKTKKQLPIKDICLLTNSNRKLIENWRKYIIALIILLSSGEYPYLKSYLNLKKVGENNE
ncbi:RNA polymerase sigma-I factor [Clostridium amazonitimonense]|uniref:RNA polymerase sigma-I factor n=1 Tax=Clostridium amazonitimonense TaxID=1499689 RepID=UPI00050961AD|nr:RNA polymerase sigma-I factor [Clostridium amazonitimonense]